MCCAVHPQGHARNHTPAGSAKGLGKLPRIDFALRRWVAAAHHGQTIQRVQAHVAVSLGHQTTQHEQQQRRVGDVEQGGRVVRLAQINDTAVFACGEPVERARQLALELFGLGLDRLEQTR